MLGTGNGRTVQWGWSGELLKLNTGGAALDGAGTLGSKLDLGGVKESDPNEVLPISKCPEVG